MNTPADLDIKHVDYPFADRLNAALVREFHACEQDPVIQRSHFAEGRHENLYFTPEQIPSLSELIGFTRRVVAEVTDREPDTVGIGYWLNAMYPGQATLPHTHHGRGEFLSGVYYVAIPANSGNLMMHAGGRTVQIQPREGRLLLFSPYVEHAVNRHSGNGLRLSIGMNFGPQ